MREKVSTLASFEDFKKTVIWQDIQKELLDWLDMIHVELEDPSVGIEDGVSDKVLHRLGGNAQSVRRAINIVDIIIEELKQDQEGEPNHDNTDE